MINEKFIVWFLTYKTIFISVVDWYQSVGRNRDLIRGSTANVDSTIWDLTGGTCLILYLILLVQ